MARVCEVCGKGPAIGNSVTTRGKAKYLGGVGTKVTGINKRQFQPNLQRVRVTVKGTNKSMRVCAQCIRSGAITKRVKAVPFRLPTLEGAAAKTKSAPAKSAPAKAKK
jgi:large subunit ribosomal protein L28